MWKNIVERGRPLKVPCLFACDCNSIWNVTSGMWLQNILIIFCHKNIDNSMSQFPKTLPHCLCCTKRAVPSPRPFGMFRSVASSYGEEFVAPRPTPKLEDHPLSAVCNWLFNICAASLRMERPFVHMQPDDTPTFREDYTPRNFMLCIHYQI